MPTVTLSTRGEKKACQNRARDRPKNKEQQTSKHMQIQELKQSLAEQMEKTLYHKSKLEKKNISLEIKLKKRSWKSTLVWKGKDIIKVKKEEHILILTTLAARCQSHEDKLNACVDNASLSLLV